ncbi:hypothetical protein CEXT_428221 [Caerostris extrusa]|uniref:Uncharacterized protein n=1 Tax=Caerostris extrusa TaxID=172846 RepID=A0AAV4PXR8_CAEEX|nr:hypothetical protein CEXT_428221 [Caerostris extrusa]
MVVVGCARNVDKIRNIAEEDATKTDPGKLVAIKFEYQYHFILVILEQIASVSGSPGIVETEFLSRFLKNDPSRKASNLFSKFHALQGRDIVDSVLHILSAPLHVEVHDIIVRPYDQKCNTF